MVIQSMHLDEQPSIYPAPDRDVLVVEAPTELERQIGIARRAATGTVNEAHARVQGLVDRWIGVEHAVERTFLSTYYYYDCVPPSTMLSSVANLVYLRTE